MDTMFLLKIIGIYLLAINLITFIFFAIDKWKAKHNKWRIREFTLMALGFVGGTIGGLAAMYTIRHKTQTPLFKFGMPIMLILQVALAVFCGYKWLI